MQGSLQRPVVAAFTPSSKPLPNPTLSSPSRCQESGRGPCRVLGKRQHVVAVCWVVGGHACCVHVHGVGFVEAGTDVGVVGGFLQGQRELCWGGAGVRKDEGK